MAAHNSSQTGLMATYDANDNYIMVDNQSLFGFNGDTMFTVAYDQDNVTVSQDPQGTAVASINNRKGATITINLDQTSPSNAVLDSLADEKRKGGFVLDAGSSTNHYNAVHCYISKKPDHSEGATAGTRAWQIHALDLLEEPLVK